MHFFFFQNISFALPLHICQKSRMRVDPKTLQATDFKNLASTEQFCDKLKSVIRTRLR